jgi:hypothetical protein
MIYVCCTSYILTLQKLAAFYTNRDQVVNPIHIKGTKMINLLTLHPRTILPRKIRPGTLRPRKIFSMFFTSSYIIYLKESE